MVGDSARGLRADAVRKTAEWGGAAEFAYPVPGSRHSAGAGEEGTRVSSPDDAGDETAQVFMPLPPPAEHSRAHFSHDLAVLVDLLGADAGAEEPGTPEWRRWARRVIRAGLDGSETLPGEFFEALVRAAVHDRDPSLNATFIKPATAAFGCLRVREALLGYLRAGVNAERAGAARAWYWASASWRWKWASGERRRGWWAHERPLDPDRSLACLQREWLEAILREFVANDDIDVRRSILPGLPLSAAHYPGELHGLAARAISIARSHPDEYIRHRVEIQVNT